MTFYKLYTESKPKHITEPSFWTIFFNSKVIHALLEVKQSVPLSLTLLCIDTQPLIFTQTSLTPAIL